MKSIGKPRPDNPVRSAETRAIKPEDKAKEMKNSLTDLPFFVQF